MATQYDAGCDTFVRTCALEGADAAARRAGLPTYTELLAALRSLRGGLVACHGGLSVCCTAESIHLGAADALLARIA